MNVRTFIPVIIAAIILVVSIGLYGVGYYLLMTQEPQAMKLDEELATKHALLEQATRSNSALATLEQDQEDLDQHLVTKSSVVTFLEEIQAQGKPFGTTVDVLSVTDEKDGKNSRIVLSLSIAGSFDGVMRTLGSIEYGSQDGIMRSVSLSGAPGATGKGGTWTAVASYSVGMRSASSTPTKP